MTAFIIEDYEIRTSTHAAKPEITYLKKWDERSFTELGSVKAAAETEELAAIAAEESAFVASCRPRQANVLRLND